MVSAISAMIPSVHFASAAGLALLAPLFLAAVVISSTFVYTSIRYHLSLAHYSKPVDRSIKPQPPPYIPYSLPFLGSALSFLAPYPGLFWATLFRTHSRSTGCATILLGGKEAHVIFSPTTVQALFKNRVLGRLGFNLDVVQKSMGMSQHDAYAFYGITEAAGIYDSKAIHLQDKFWNDYLLRTDRVNELTSEFTNALIKELKDVLPSGSDATLEIGIYDFLKPRMFIASTTAFMGEKVLKECTNLCDLFFDFDRVFMTLLFGIPRWINSEPYRIREAILAPLQQFHEMMFEKYKGRPVDPESDISWEPDFGSRANRAKQIYHESRGMTIRSKAALDLGFIFGISSNAIPATGWILMHLLDPDGDKTLLPRVLDELERATATDGTLNVSTLCSSPLLQSILHEVLRLYVDVLVTRELHEDLVLPLDDTDRKVLFGKKSIVLAPSWVGHRDDTFWTSPPSTVFFAERFLKVDTSGKQIFTTGGANGKVFPFGGGRTICPGRVFAKQEVLASVAIFLLTFEFEVVGFTDLSGRDKHTFPSLNKQYSGNGVMAMDGDVKVKMKRRRRQR